MPGKIGRAKVSYHTLVSADYIAHVADEIIGVDTTGGAVTITLPTIERRYQGRSYIVKDEGGHAGTEPITVVAEGGETIDGVPADTINADYGSAGYYSDGTNWFKV